MPDFTQQAMSDHDLLIGLNTKMDGVMTSLTKIEEGKTQSCVIHTEAIRSHTLQIKAIWGVLAVVGTALTYAFITHFLV